ncbi:hypothetical protein MNV49_007124 [Pseudohyphozyma bogoriensis]|nr:hypothetical protein MNV49_007124 [Pseudohyphozyma bogoriensis]
MMAAQLAVVVASLANGERGLALGNVVGSNIANILGSFSLGLLVIPTTAFDRSAKAYATILLAISAAVVVLSQIAGGKAMGRVAGGVLVGVFGVYVASIAVGIRMGMMEAPEDSDSESDSDSDTSDSDSDDEVGEPPSVVPPTSTTPLLPKPAPRRRPKSTLHHIVLLLLSTLALSLSGYLLSKSCTSFASLLHFPPSSVGLTILSLATTLPEKVVAVYAGARGQPGILVANTVGSNVFLLTLVLGVCLLWRPQRGVEEKVRVEDAVVLLASAGALALLTWMGKTRKSVGALLLVGYALYIARVVLR